MFAAPKIDRSIRTIPTWVFEARAIRLQVLILGRHAAFATFDIMLL